MYTIDIGGVFQDRPLERTSFVNYELAKKSICAHWKRNSPKSYAFSRKSLFTHLGKKSPYIMNIPEITICTLENKWLHELWIARKSLFALFMLWIENTSIWYWVQLWLYDLLTFKLRAILKMVAYSSNGIHFPQEIYWNKSSERIVTPSNLEEHRVKVLGIPVSQWWLLD